MIIGINRVAPSFGAKFAHVAASQLNDQIKNKLPIGEVTAVLKDKKGVLVHQQDGRAKMLHRFVDGVLRERTEFLDGNKYKEIYSSTGELMKKIQRVDGSKIVADVKNGTVLKKFDKII